MDTRNTKKLGLAAEIRAREYLLAKGMQLIEKNFSCFCGEIDLIMQDNDVVVFVEVRSCHGPVDHALESIDHYKQSKLIKTATYYLQKKSLLDKVDCRFDVIGMNDYQLEWIKNAFFADNF